MYSSYLNVKQNSSMHVQVGEEEKEFETQPFVTRSQTENGRRHLGELQGDLGFSRHKDIVTCRRSFGSWGACRTSVGGDVHKLKIQTVLFSLESLV